MLLADRLNAAYAPLAPRLVVEARTNGQEVELNVVQFEHGKVVDVAGVSWSHDGSEDRLVACASALALTRSANAPLMSFYDEPMAVRSLLLDHSLQTTEDFAAVLRDPTRLATALQRASVFRWSGLDAVVLYPLTEEGRQHLTPALFRQLLSTASPEQAVAWIEAWVEEDWLAEHTFGGRALALSAWEQVAPRTPDELVARALAAIDRIPDRGRPDPHLVRTLSVG